MRRYIENPSGRKGKRGREIRLIYMKRIQVRIDRELDMLFWLCKNHPDTFLDKDYRVNSYGHVIKNYKNRNRGNERMKLLLLCLKALTQNADVELTKEWNKDAESEGA